MKKWVIGIVAILSSIILLKLITSSGSKNGKVTGIIPTVSPTAIPILQLISPASSTCLRSVGFDQKRC